MPPPRLLPAESPDPSSGFHSSAGQRPRRRLPPPRGKKVTVQLITRGSVAVATSRGSGAGGSEDARGRRSWRGPGVRQSRSWSCPQPGRRAQAWPSVRPARPPSCPPPRQPGSGREPSDAPQPGPGDQSGARGHPGHLRRGEGPAPPPGPELPQTLLIQHPREEPGQLGRGTRSPQLAWARSPPSPRGLPPTPAHR